MENEILLNVVEVTNFGNRRGGRVKLRRPQTYHTNKYHCTALFYRILEAVPNSPSAQYSSRLDFYWTGYVFLVTGPMRRREGGIGLCNWKVLQFAMVSDACRLKCHCISQFNMCAHCPLIVIS